MLKTGKIRKLLPDEAPSCHAVIAESFTTAARDLGLTIDNCPSHPSFLTVEKVLTSMNGAVEYFGLFLGGRLTGTAALENSDREKGTVFLERLAVLPAFRHQGSGARLLHFCFDYAGKSGMDKIAIGIIDRHDILKRWYQTFGFVENIKKEFRHLPFTVCYMEKKLG